MAGYSAELAESRAAGFNPQVERVRAMRPTYRYTVFDRALVLPAIRVEFTIDPLAERGEFPKQEAATSLPLMSSLLFQIRKNEKQ